MANQISCENRKARKQYECDFCGTVISAGSEYEDQTNTDGGEIYHFRGHLNCSKLYTELEMHKDDWFSDGLDQDLFRDKVQDFIYDRLGEEEYEKFDSATVDFSDYVAKAIELLTNV